MDTMMALQDQIEKLRESGPRAASFFSEVWAELKKVHWPTRNETYAATMVVLIVTVVVAVLLGLVDYGITQLVRFILS